MERTPKATHRQYQTSKEKSRPREIGGKVMVVLDFGGTHDVNSDAQIEALLVTRYEQGLNEFWLYRGSQTDPALLIQANGALARVHYFPEEDHPGFQSMGPAPGLPANGRTMFASNTPTETFSRPNDTVVAFSLALAAAKEFARSPKLPGCIEWFEL
jgi:hypothetical protein